MVPEVRADISRLDSTVTAMPPARISHNLSFTPQCPVRWWFEVKHSVSSGERAAVYSVPCLAFRQFHSSAPLHTPAKKQQHIFNIALSISTSGRPKREMHARFIAEKKTTPELFHSLTL